MARTPEAAVKAAIKKILDEVGAYYVMYVPVGYGANKGTPDFLVCHQGRFIGIEAKAGKGKTTALQELAIAKIRDAGGIAVVVREDNIDWLRDELIKLENEDE